MERKKLIIIGLILFSLLLVSQYLYFSRRRVCPSEDIFEVSNQQPTSSSSKFEGEPEEECKCQEIEPCKETICEEKVVKKTEKSSSSVLDLVIPSGTTMQLSRNLAHSSELKIAILMYYTKNIRSYADIAAEINRAYCNKQGYDLIVFQTSKENVVKSAKFDRVFYAKEILPFYDYVLYLDADAVIQNFRRRIEYIIEKYGERDFYTGGFPIGFNQHGKRYNPKCKVDGMEVSCGINSGSFMVRNTAAGHKIMADWWGFCADETLRMQTLGRFVFASEQRFLQKMVDINYNDMLSDGGMVFVDPWDINRVDSSVTTEHGTEFVFHLWGSFGDNRVNALKALREGNLPVGGKQNGMDIGEVMINTDCFYIDVDSHL